MRNPRSALPTLIRFSSTQRATRSCSAWRRVGAWAATRGSSLATIWSWSAPVSKSMFRVTRSIAASATSAIAYTEYSPARLALRASRSCSGAVQARALSLRASPSSAAGPGAGRAAPGSGCGVYGTVVVTPHTLGGRTDITRNGTDRHGAGQAPALRPAARCAAPGCHDRSTAPDGTAPPPYQAPRHRCFTAARPHGTTASRHSSDDTGRIIMADTVIDLNADLGEGFGRWRL